MLRFGDRVDIEAAADGPGETPALARASGFSLHAAVAVPPNDRRRLERLCRYVGRPPVATERLSELPDGRLVYELRHRWRDGATHVAFEPLELIDRLAALVPPPRFHTVRYYSWPELMRRVFEIEVLCCPRCETGPMRILAAMHPPTTTQAILESLGLPTRAPPIAPARPIAPDWDLAELPALLDHFSDYGNRTAAAA